MVALAGATGSGKSSLLNALAGEAGLRRSAYAARRPRRPPRWSGDADGAGPLLDWLEVPRRHAARTDGGAGPDGLVLLDLPDFDSVRLAHRLEVDRLVELVDLLVWVLDPQKYADAALHDRYLRPLAGHADVMLVVLNQVDRLDPAAREACLADLRRLLDREGLAGTRRCWRRPRSPARAWRSCTRAGHRAAARRAAVQRLEADLHRTATALRASAPDRGGCRRRRARPAACRWWSGGRPSGPVRGPGDWSEVAPATAGERAGGTREPVCGRGPDRAGRGAHRRGRRETIAAAVARSHRSRAAAVTGWPFTRWLRKLRPDPVRRLRLPPTPNELVRTSLPGPSAVQRARVDTALRTLTDNAAGACPTRGRAWSGGPRPARPRTCPTCSTGPSPAPTSASAGSRGGGCSPASCRRCSRRRPSPGLLWLLVLLALDWLRFPEPPMPHVGRVPLPTLLLVGGALAGLLLALLARRLAAAGARRRARTARRRVRDRVERVADERVLAPVEAELAVHKRLCAALDRLAS